MGKQREAKQRCQVAGAEELADDACRRRHGGKPGKTDCAGEDIEGRL